MSVFIAVLWAASRPPTAKPRQERNDGHPARAGFPRRAESRLLTMTPGSTASATAGASSASYEVEIQKKFALAAACAELALLAKGIARRAQRISVWAQAVISVVVFAGYYVCIIIGEQMADRSAITPALAMWCANMIVLLLAMLMLRVAQGRHNPAVSASSPAVRVVSNDHPRSQQSQGVC